jgi:hypothetical protein
MSNFPNYLETRLGKAARPVLVVQEGPYECANGHANPDEAKYDNSIMVGLPYPTSDVRMLTKAVMQVVDHIYRPDFKYSKGSRYC